MDFPSILDTLDHILNHTVAQRDSKSLGWEASHGLSGALQKEAIVRDVDHHLVDRLFFLIWGPLPTLLLSIYSSSPVIISFQPFLLFSRYLIYIRRIFRKLEEARRRCGVAVVSLIAKILARYSCIVGVDVSQAIGSKMLKAEVSSWLGGNIPLLRRQSPVTLLDCRERVCFYVEPR